MTQAAGRRAQEAGELLDLALTLDRDEERARKGERPVFALDANVAIFLSDPSREASRGERDGLARRGLGAVFDDDPREPSEIAAHALAEHIYLELRAHAPLLLIPPMTKELHGYALGLARRHANPSADEASAWETEARKLLSRLSSQGRYSERVETLIRQVQEVLFLRYGPSSALRRMRTMLGERHVLSADIAAEAPKCIADDVLREVLRAPRTPRELVQLATVATRWMDLGLSRRANGFNDAFVLARLEQMNRSLEERGSVHRLIFVSADRNLLELAAKADDPQVRLRDPRAWLTRLPIFQRAPTGRSTSIVDLLKMEVRGSGDEADDDGSAQRWVDYLEKATAAFDPRPEARDLFFDRVKDMVARYSASLDRFHEDIVRLQAQAWEDCFSVSAMTAASEAQQSHRLHSRNVPPLVFEKWAVTQVTIERFLDWHAPEDFDAHAFRQGIEDIDAEDGTGYARYVALAAIFASRGDWDAAGSLAKRAGERATPGSGGFGAANGREGAFLEAVCIRHNAKSEAGLGAAAAALERAVAISADERAAAGQEGDPDAARWDIVPERFEAERIATELSRFYFRRYGREGEVRTEETTVAAELVRDLDAFLDHLLRRMAALSGDWWSIQERALAQLVTRTVINVLGLSLVTGVDGPEAEHAWSVALSRGLAGPAARGLSRLGMVTLLAYRRVGARDRLGQDAQTLRRLLAERPDRQVFPYDAARFSEIERRVRAH